MILCLACCMQKHNTDDCNSPSKISWHIIRTEMLDDLFTLILKTHSVWRHPCFVEAQIGTVLPNTLWMQTQNTNPAALYLPIPESILTYNAKTFPWATRHDEKFLQSLFITMSFLTNLYLMVFLHRDKIHTVQSTKIKFHLSKIHGNNIRRLNAPFTASSIYSRMTYLLHIILETHFDIIHVRKLRYYDIKEANSKINVKHQQSHPANSP